MVEASISNGFSLVPPTPPVVVVLCEGIVKPNAEKGSKAKRIELKRSEGQGSGQQSDQRERDHRVDIEKPINFTISFVANQSTFKEVNLFSPAADCR